MDLGVFCFGGSLWGLRVKRGGSCGVQEALAPPGHSASSGPGSISEEDGAGPDLRLEGPLPHRSGGNFLGPVFAGTKKFVCAHEAHGRSGRTLPAPKLPKKEVLSRKTGPVGPVGRVGAVGCPQVHGDRAPATAGPAKRSKAGKRSPYSRRKCCEPRSGELDWSRFVARYRSPPHERNKSRTG